MRRKWGGGGGSRRRVNLIQKPTTILLGKNTSESPWLVLEGLDVHDLDEKNVAWLGAFDFERPAEVVHLGEVDILHVVG